jgi:GNAT superfamily N-acetyltransferase
MDRAGGKMEEIEFSNKDEDAQFIKQKLNEYNCIFVPPDHHERLCLVARREDRIIGGVVGGTYWNWLYIEWFWVDGTERNNGLGTRLLAKAEEMAIHKGCRNAHLETHDFQSLEFYKKRNYVVFGKLDDLPEGHTKFYLCKHLVKD